MGENGVASFQVTEVVVHVIVEEFSAPDMVDLPFPLHPRSVTARDVCSRFFTVSHQRDVLVDVRAMQAAAVTSATQAQRLALRCQTT